MEYSQRLSNVSVLGAAGKMGSGILLLMAQELYSLSREAGNSDLKFILNAIDISEEGLKGIMKYVEKLTRKTAERKPDNIRRFFNADMPEDEMISAYVSGVMGIINPTTELAAANNSLLVFEAASEDKDLKVKLMSEIDKNSKQDVWFFTNTSSIPIAYIDEKAALEGRILGYHFYNPPAVQKLVELITTANTRPELRELALELAGRIRKTIVPSNDIAGFIGNGHFMRDALYAFNKALELSNDTGLINAIYAVNSISQKYLVRPMGIFQLCDYVGLDVVQFIMKVMDPYMKEEDLHSGLLDEMVSSGVKGGQNSDGSQKNGFLRYEGARITGIYDLDTKEYVDSRPVETVVDAFLGELPAGHRQWKELIRAEDKQGILSQIFSDLKAAPGKGSQLAFEYGRNSKNIGMKLVEDGVALNEEDVNKVLLTGFFHLYGPINNYFD